MALTLAKNISIWIKNWETDLLYSQDCLIFSLFNENFK